jgi:hypothetical protein
MVTIYDDMDLMLKDIGECVVSTGATILSDDDPINRYIGFTAVLKECAIETVLYVMEDEDPYITWKVPCDVLMKDDKFKSLLQCYKNRIKLAQELSELKSKI